MESALVLKTTADTYGHPFALPPPYIPPPFAVLPFGPSTGPCFVPGIVMPKAVATRTVQIIGTFVLLNGIIYTLKDHVPF